MPARLILNADDFGQTLGINRAIAELHDAGALTSATLMAAGAAFDDAVALARARPRLGVGCHVVFIDGTPVLRHEEIPTLLGADGKTFRPSLAEFHVAVLSGRVSQEHLAREALAQIQRLQRAGINVTHVDTHKHTHVLPQVARALLMAAERAGVGAVRCPFEPAWSLRATRPGTTRRLQVQLMAQLQPRFAALEPLRKQRLATTNGTLGIAVTGTLDAAGLRALLAALPVEGTFEIVVHPGYDDAALAALPTRLRASREIERRALLEVFASAQPYPSAPQLVHYGALGRIET